MNEKDGKGEVKDLPLGLKITVIVFVTPLFLIMIGFPPTRYCVLGALFGMSFIWLLFRLFKHSKRDLAPTWLRALHPFPAFVSMILTVVNFMIAYMWISEEKASLETFLIGAAGPISLACTFFLAMAAPMYAEEELKESEEPPGF